jgi:calcium-binding protein CML
MAQSPSTSKIESSSRETREKKVIEIFQKFDTNKDGKLSREEIKQGLRSLKLPHSEDTIDLLLKTLDTNQDGHVTFQVIA